MAALLRSSSLTSRCSFSHCCFHLRNDSSGSGSCPFSAPNDPLVSPSFRSALGRPLSTSSVSPIFRNFTAFEEGAKSRPHAVDRDLSSVLSKGNDGRDHGNNRGGGGGGGRGGDGDGSDGRDYGSRGGDGARGISIAGAFMKGWNDRVGADAEFPFKVVMEQVVGVGANVLGDMASRPNFGLNELDFVFSTIIVGSILNFSLMYMLAPTSAASAAMSSLPGPFAMCPSGHMFEHGSFSIAQRLGTFVYKGAVFATVGFAAGLLGTAISNGLIRMRKKMDPTFESQNKAPPTFLNAATWALHMGISSNFRYQAVNGLEFTLANLLPLPAFKASVLFTRAANNVLGGMSFVMLARLTGSQKVEASQEPVLEPQEVQVLSQPLLKPIDETKANGD